jgi:flavin reductase (DIM6/NTAB) family NADH-FMN oxidoreductase RutF
MRPQTIRAASASQMTKRAAELPARRLNEIMPQVSALVHRPRGPEPLRALHMIGRMVAPDELRGLMRHWPHGVSVLTVDYDGDRMGVTVSSLVSLSLDPPLVGVSIGKEASCYELLRRSGAWAVSLLGGDQAELAQRFAAGRPPIVHWEGVAVHEGQLAPLIDGAVGWIEARTRAEHDAGDHTFFIGDVVAIEHGPAKSALMYRESTYHPL